MKVLKQVYFKSWGGAHFPNTVAATSLARFTEEERERTTIPVHVHVRKNLFFSRMRPLQHDRDS